MKTMFFLLSQTFKKGAGWYVGKNKMDPQKNPFVVSGPRAVLVSKRFYFIKTFVPVFCVSSVSMGVMIGRKKRTPNCAVHPCRSRNSTRKIPHDVTPLVTGVLS